LLFVLFKVVRHEDEKFFFSLALAEKNFQFKLFGWAGASEACIVCSSSGGQTMIEGSLTVTFEDPYWVGIFERLDERGYSVAKILFGSEPNAEIVHQVVLQQYHSLSFSKPTPEPPSAQKLVNFKRRQRELKELMERAPGLQPDAAQALKEERQRQAAARKKRQKEDRVAEEAYKLQLRTERKKEKQKGH
jgi:hypothetical protein